VETEADNRPRRVLVIVPAYNEASCIASVLADLRAGAPWADVVVVDDGSTDTTAETARSAGAAVLSLATNLGVGGAVQTGYMYAHAGGYDAAVQFDGDGQHRSERIADLLKPVWDGADVVVGSRLLGRRSYRFSLARWLGSRMLAAMVSLMVGRRITDPTSGFRAASRKAIGFFARHYPQSYLADTTESLVWAARHGMDVREVPTRMRMPDHSSINNLKGLLHTLRMLLAVAIDRMEKPFED